ncbi:MAG: DNA-processing protein DprA, partial [Bacteroidota bacterium]
MQKKDYPFYEIALSEVEGVGAVTARQLIAYCGSAQAVFEQSRSRLLKIPNIGEQTIKALQKGQVFEKAESIITESIKKDSRIFCYFQEDYPQRLKQLPDAPLILYYRGKANLNPTISVAIVGTRDASEYGRQVTEALVQDLLPYQALIVSGLAYGIDIAAHRAALQQGLPTLGVMASGLDIIYPALHKASAQQMVQQGGGLVTENSFGVKPDAARFPARNRIIAGLADVVVVVEAKARGGALITAEMANAYHREVFALPGDIKSPTSVGCHNLIKTHKAHLLSKVDDLAYIMNWDLDEKKVNSQMKIDFEGLDLGTVEKNIYELLESFSREGLLVDQIAYKLQLSVAEVNVALLNLEMLGLVKSQPGKKF